MLKSTFVAVSIITFNYLKTSSEVGILDHFTVQEFSYQFPISYGRAQDNRTVVSVTGIVHAVKTFSPFYQ